MARKEKVSDVVLHECKAEEVEIDKLERKLNTMEACGDQNTHHARCIRVILSLYHHHQ